MVSHLSLTHRGQTEWTNGGHDFGYWRPALKGQLDWMLAKFPTS